MPAITDATLGGQRDPYSDRAVFGHAGQQLPIPADVTCLYKSVCCLLLLNLALLCPDLSNLPSSFPYCPARCMLAVVLQIVFAGCKNHSAY